jgi:hypothetical protein
VVTPRDPLVTSFKSISAHNESAWLHPRQVRRHAKVGIV